MGPDLPDRLLQGLQPSRLVVTYLETREVAVDGHTPGSYPINALRNAALRSAKTSHIFICDVDFLPSEGLYAALRKLIVGRHGPREDVAGASAGDAEVMRRDATAVVVPAFRLKGRCREPNNDAILGPHRPRYQLKCFEHYLPRVPRHSQALKKCLEMNWCEQFCPNCHTHGSTGYPAWWAQQDTLRRIECFDSMRYEPYVVVERTARLPPFDEHYFGYGKNKIQWITHLQHAGFDFHVLKEEFVIHVPHYPSVDKDEWVQAMKEKPHDTVDWHIRFLRYVHKTHPNYTLPRCANFYEYM